MKSPANARVTPKISSLRSGERFRHAQTGPSDLCRGADRRVGEDDRVDRGAVERREGEGVFRSRRVDFRRAFFEDERTVFGTKLFYHRTRQSLFNRRGIFVLRERGSCGLSQTPAAAKRL